jgi:putative tricarboxylic transport membrane protein
MLKALLKPESLIAAGLMALAAYFMWYAVRLPIGWDGARGPGGGAFPFWLSAIMFLAAGGVFLRSVLAGVRPEDLKPFFEPGMLGPVLAVALALGVTIALMPLVGTYIAIPLFMFWYLRFFGRNGWTVTLALTLATPVVLFFFFEVALLILLPKGITEPLFFPLYAMFF